jgi:hypothetical protein
MKRDKLFIKHQHHAFFSLLQCEICFFLAALILFSIIVVVVVRVDLEISFAYL